MMGLSLLILLFVMLVFAAIGGGLLVAAFLFLSWREDKEPGRNG